MGGGRLRRLDAAQLAPRLSVNSRGSDRCPIWLRTRSGRVLFDAQQDVDLRNQAQDIANGLHKPLKVGPHVDLPTDAAAGG